MSQRRAAARPVSLPLAVVIAASTVAALVFGLALVSQHHAFYSNAFDLGFFDQIVWNTSQGRWFENSFVRYNFLGQHIEPVLLAFALVYTVMPAVEVLLITQAVAAAAAAIPLYLLAQRWLQQPAAAALVALAYLASVSLHRAVTFDFHPEVMGPLLVFSAAALVSAGRLRAGLLVFGLLFLLKEEAAIAGAGFAWLLWMLGHRRHGLAVLATSVVYFVGTAALMSAFRGGVPGDLQDRYGYLGADLSSLALGVLTKPGAVIQQLGAPGVVDGLISMLSQSAGLALVSPLALGALPLTLAHLLSLHPEQGRLALHYGILPFALFTLAGVDGLRRVAGLPFLRRWPAERVKVGIATMLLLAAVAGSVSGGPLGVNFEPRRYQDSEHARAVRSVLAKAPPGIPVSAQAGLVPHLSQRQAIFEFPGINEARVVVIDRTGWKSTYSQAAGYDTVLASLPARGFRLMFAANGAELYCLEGRCE